MPLALLYILTFVILLGIEIGYIPIARAHGWSTERNRRSDGHPVTVIGGGIIFYIAMVIWSLAMGILYGRPDMGGNFLVGITMVAACSFVDDIMQLKVWIRLVVQFVAVLFLGFQCSVFALPWWLWPMFLICTVAFVNAYNFMDGINGITTAYSVTVLGLFLYLNTEVLHFTSGSMIVMALIGLLIFGFFNFRRRALVFAGDVGSISMGFIVAAVLVDYIIETRQVTAVMFVIVYGVDTLLTVIRRVAEGENILLPHRKHVYQLLAHVWRANQLVVASGYALLQLGISLGYLQMHTTLSRVIYACSVTGFLVMLYFFIMMASETRRRNMEIRRKRPDNRRSNTRRSSRKHLPVPQPQKEFNLN